MPRKKQAYDATLRFRAYKKLAERIERIIAARGYGNPPDLMREGTTEYVVREEARLGLPPFEDPSTKPVRYSKRKRK